jgi:NADH:ubiquinone oxidoreductase subunit 2 (subunit N)
MPGGVATLVFLLVFFMFGLLIGAVNLRRNSFLAIALTFAVILALLGDVSMLIVFFVGLTVSSVMAYQMRKMNEQKLRKRESIRL